MRSHTFLKPPARPAEFVSKAITSKETVILFGDETDPAIIAAKKRIEYLGRKVEVTLRPAHDTGVGICGQHLCSCTEPCKSIHYIKP